MNELTTWDYAASVERVRPKVLKLHDLTLDIYHELWEARDALSAQGARSDLTSGQMSRSWEGYCADVGLVKRTVNRWLTRYDPEERKLIEAPEPEAPEGTKVSARQPHTIEDASVNELLRGVTLLEDEHDKLLATLYAQAAKDDPGGWYDHYRKALQARGLMPRSKQKCERLIAEHSGNYLDTEEIFRLFPVQA